MVDKQKLSELAMYWYFLSSQLDAEPETDELVDELIDMGALLKKGLSSGNYSALEPLNAWVSESVGIRVWLDSNGDIQVGDLK